ncbi:uncharacterized protein V1518DRAFT_410443 [Limtongia smithiae]|uniref:uncharacterized protein n=1 Tax=Limtongia smithiae TaxID=1125753 RepID=UPI0034CD3268
MVVSLSGKVALVTGGSAGLGAAVARRLAGEGCAVAINYASSADRARALADEIAAEHGVRTLVLCGDVASEAVCRDLVERTVAELGRLDLVVSNAGWTRIVNFADLDGVTEHDFDKCYALNVKSHFWLFRAAKPHLASGDEEFGGSFLVTSSVAGLKPAGSSIPYAITKSAAVHLVKVLAKAHGPNIRVNAICPSLLLTEWGKSFGPERIKAVTASLPLKRLPSLDDAADAFISTARNTSITGSIIVVDSGMAVV